MRLGHADDRQVTAASAASLKSCERAKRPAGARGGGPTRGGRAQRRYLSRCVIKKKRMYRVNYKHYLSVSRASERARFARATDSGKIRCER